MSKTKAATCVLLCLLACCAVGYLYLYFGTAVVQLDNPEEEIVIEYNTFYDIAEESMKATNEYHVKYGGSRCPFCGSKELEGQVCTTGGGDAEQFMMCIECETCGEVWTDVYKLISWEEE